MALKLKQIAKSYLETSEWGAPESDARPTPAASHASGRKNAGGGYAPRVAADAPIPSLQDDPEFVAIDKRYQELQGEYNALDAEISRLNGSLAERTKTEAERRLVEASALTSRPMEGNSKALPGVDEVHRTIDALRERRNLVHRALQLQTTLRNNAWNRASKAALQKARAHHEALVLQATEAAIELSHRLTALSDYVYRIEEGQVFVGEFRQLTPPGEGGGVGRMAHEWSPIREHLRRMEQAGYPLPANAERATERAGAA